MYPCAAAPRGGMRAEHGGSFAEKWCMLLSRQIFGINVRFERSWGYACAGATLAFALAAEAVAPELSTSGAVLIGAGVALAITASMLVHELAHARVAARAGIDIEHIRLFAAGAACTRARPVEDAREQFLIAAAGPLASVALAVALLALAIAFEAFGLPSAGSAALSFVALANCLIAVSNVLPVFPFDGGKVMHAVFWRSTGCETAATRRLRRSGREFARIVIVLGFLTATYAGQIALGLVIAGFGVYLLRLPLP